MMIGYKQIYMTSNKSKNTSSGDVSFREKINTAKPITNRRIATEDIANNANTQLITLQYDDK